MSYSEVTVDENGFTAWEYKWQFWHDSRHGGESEPSGTTEIRWVDFFDWVEENIHEVPSGQNRTLLDMYWADVHEQDVFDEYCDAHCPAELVEAERAKRREMFDLWIEAEHRMAKSAQ